MGEAFNHIHPLREVMDNTAPFDCDKCRVTSFGLRQECTPCKYTIHPCCASCPKLLVTSLHSHNQLCLIDISKYGISGLCNLCGRNVRGIYYQCTDVNCGFAAHPTCLDSRGGLPPPPKPAPVAPAGHSPWHNNPYYYSTPGYTYSNVYAPPNPYYTANYYRPNYLHDGPVGYVPDITIGGDQSSGVGVHLIRGAARFIGTMFGLPPFT